MADPSPDTEQKIRWAYLPRDFLENVIMKLEPCKEAWPTHPDVVACAGVCSSWRSRIQNLVPAPLQSGKDSAASTNTVRLDPQSCQIINASPMLNHEQRSLLQLNTTGNRSFSTHVPKSSSANKRKSAKSFQKFSSAPKKSCVQSLNDSFNGKAFIMEQEGEEGEVALSTLTKEMEDLATLMEAMQLDRRSADWLDSVQLVLDDVRTFQKFELMRLGKISMQEEAETPPPLMQPSEVTNAIREKLAKVRELKSRAPFVSQESGKIPGEISCLSEQMDMLRYLSETKNEAKEQDDQAWLEAVCIVGEEVVAMELEAKELNNRSIDKLAQVLKLRGILTSSFPYEPMQIFHQHPAEQETVFYKKLASKMSELVSIRDNLLDNLGTSKLARGGEVTDRPKLGWNDQEVDTIGEEVAHIEFEMRKLRKWAVKKLQRVYELKAGGIHPVRMPFKNVLVGNDSKMEELKSWVFADDVGVIGIVGPGGIGKTSLLRQIQSELPLEGFKLVIYVNIKKNSSMLEQVQREIIQKLDFPWLDDASLRTRAVFNALNRNKFALLLDNVSGMLDLQSIGVPIGPESRSQNKVIVATESTVICHQMGAERLLVMEGLTEAQAWDLFQQNAWKAIDSSDLEPEFVQLGRLLAEKCGGVPLSLIIVGRAVAALTSVEDWRKATDALAQMQSHYAGTEREPYFPLEFCLNNLQDSMLHSVLLYCSLFPENSSIDEETLIDYCIADGLLGEYNHIDEARGKGHDVVERLVSACLLEKGIDREKTLRIHHEIIREMALCLASSHYYGDHGKNNILVDLNSGLQEWSVASRICLVDNNNQLNELPQEPICLNLLTLLLQNNTISRVPRGFFRQMPHLRILDLSRTRISVIPSEVGVLGNLRFLNLAYTELTSLPTELGHLAKLAHLDLTCTFSLSVIPHQALSMLSRLQVLYMFGCEYGGWIGEDSEDDDDVEAGSWKLVGHVGGQPGDDEKKTSYGGDDERGMGNWKVISYGGDDERGMGNWKLTSHGGDDESGMVDGKLISHGGDDERRMGNWKLENALEREPENWRSHGGDDERGLGNWRLEASSSMDDSRQVSFDELECLGQLSDLRLTLRTASCLARFFKSPVLPKGTQLLHLRRCSGLISIHTSAFWSMKRLRELHIEKCVNFKELIIGDDQIVEDSIPLSIEVLFLSQLPSVKITLNGTPPCKVFQNLRYLSISCCHKLKDATWVLELPSLEEFILSNCYEMEHMISDGEEAVDEVALLPRLKRLALINLPKLKFICKQILVFPALEFLGVTDCDELTKLPLGKESAINLKEIRGEKEWWNSLQWEDNNTKYAFALVFIEGTFLD